MTSSSSSTTTQQQKQFTTKTGEVLDIVLRGNLDTSSASLLSSSSSSCQSSSYSPAAVTVVILTYGRPEISEAVQSVYNQDFQEGIHLLVLGDNYPRMRTVTSLPDIVADERSSMNNNIQLTALNCSSQEENTYHRVARLRNIAVDLITTPFLTFLDDDNLWEPNHLSTLISTIRQGMYSSGAVGEEGSKCKKEEVSLVHSWRRLVLSDNTPFVPQRYPWLPAGEESEKLFDLYIQSGIMNSASSVVRDRAYCQMSGHEYGMVDMGEWLFRKEFFGSDDDDGIRFDDKSPAGNKVLHSGEDDKLLRKIRQRSIPMVCTEKPTLRYRLGGFSNSHTTTPSPASSSDTTSATAPSSNSSIPIRTTSTDSFSTCCGSSETPLSGTPLLGSSLSQSPSSVAGSPCSDSTSSSLFSLPEKGVLQQSEVGEKFSGVREEENPERRKGVELIIA